MEEVLINFETAKLLDNLQTHNNIDCNTYFYQDGDEGYLSHLEDWSDLGKQGIKWIKRPSQSLLQKWLREFHKIHIVIHDGFDIKTDIISFYPILYPFVKNKNKDEGYEYLGNVWKDKYEDALEIGLQEALKTIEDENRD